MIGDPFPMFLYVNDLTAERRRLRDLGIALGDDIPGDYSTLAQLRDPDGNLITLATPQLMLNVGRILRPCLWGILDFAIPLECW